MNNKFSFVFIFLVLLNLSASAGTLDSIGVTKIDNKLHIKYMVSPGETIYGISTKYGVPVSDLIELNPELESGLKVGQVINIPYNPEAQKPVNKADDNVLIHKVQPGETFYALSKKYNTSVNDLMKMNNLELKVGQEIIVGYKNQEKKNPIDTNKSVVNVNPDKTVVVNKETKVEEVNPSAEQITPYPFDPTKKQVLVIPFDPYLYFSDADDEIAARSNMNRTKVRQVFRKRLNAMIQAPGYENILLLGGKAKDSLSDLNKIYASVSYSYQQSIVSPYYQETEKAPEVKKNKTWVEKQKEKIANPGETKYDIPVDHGSYFGVQIKHPDFFPYFNTKYSVDYYIFVSQFEVKTNYEHCLDRAAQNYERTFTTHFSIFDSTGKQIAGNKFKTHYNSNSNYIYQILADNMEKIANRIIAELPPPNK